MRGGRGTSGRLGRGGSVRGRIGLVGAALAGAIALGGGALAWPAARPPFGAEDAALRHQRAGAALRAALRAQEGGEFERAEALFEAVSQRHAIVADYADLFRLRSMIANGRVDAALTLVSKHAYADSPLAPEFDEIAGDAHAARGEGALARAAWQRASEATVESDHAASLQLRVADSLWEERAVAAAAEVYLRIWTRYALSPETERASAQLDVLEDQLGLLRTGQEYRKRADTFFRGRYNESALEAYERALALGMSDTDRRRAQDKRAQTLFRLRRYPLAAEAYAALPPTEDALIGRARSHARSGKVERAAQELEQVGKRSRSSQATYAYLLAALLHEGEGDDAPARKLYERVVKRGGPHAASALWRLGWGAFRAGDYARAIQYFDQLVARESDEIAALRPRYWKARATELAGGEGAVAEFTRIAHDYPLSYYGWRSRDRARRGGASGLEAAAGAIRPGKTRLAAEALERPRILLEAGLVEEARAELNRLFVRARGLEDRLNLAALYTDTGDYNRAQRLMVDAYLVPLAQRPEPETLELWWHAWPAPFLDQVLTATGSTVEPALVYAIMREESGYRPAVRSVSGALGLLQIMPTTGERLAKDVGLAGFATEDLFEPSVNIQLGSAYLAELMHRFDGRASAAISSYNAGASAVRRWIEEDPVEDDEWVESIPYQQTRRYVKRVLRSLHVYRVLY